MNRPFLVCAILSLGFSCGRPRDAGENPENEPPPPAVALGSPAKTRNVVTVTEPSSSPFTNGERAFASVRDSLLHHYAGASVTEDMLYRAAVLGMLEHVDPARASYNKLLAPDDLAALHEDLRGEVVGIGAQIRFDEATGYTDVLSVLPGTPAEKAGLRAGDKILSVSGKLYKGKTGKDVLSDIRGKAGEPVALAVLREDKILSIAPIRGVVAYDVVEEFVLPDAVGYLRIRSFNAKTRPAIDAAMGELTLAGAKRLVIDMRGNPGGSFDDAISVAEAFLPAGAPIVRIEKAGEKEQVLSSNGTPKLASAPIAVLVDGDTASGGEFVSVALMEGRQAELIGARTFGKWSVQTLEDLPNGYAVKYTISELRSGAGKRFDGVGVTPDLLVTADPKVIASAMLETDPVKRLAEDAPLRTACSILRGKP
jgi:carboxyl-terminal processing protease